MPTRLIIVGFLGSIIGNQESTRCLGNFLIKGGYRDFEDLSVASSEPVISEPEIHGGITIDDSCKCLLLMSDGLYKSLEEASDGRSSDQVNKDIAQLIVSQFRVQSTLTGVAQAVVDKTVRIHHDFAMSNGIISKRDDITLLIRNFNFPLPNAKQSPINPTVRFNSNVDIQSMHSTLTEEILTDSVQSPSVTNSYESTLLSNQYDTNNSDYKRSEYDGDAKIPSYVDFTDFFSNVEVAKKNNTLPEGIEFD